MIISASSYLLGEGSLISNTINTLLFDRGVLILNSVISMLYEDGYWSLYTVICHSPTRLNVMIDSYVYNNTRVEVNDLCDIMITCVLPTNAKEASSFFVYLRFSFFLDVCRGERETWQTAKLFRVGGISHPESNSGIGAYHFYSASPRWYPTWRAASSDITCLLWIKNHDRPSPHRLRE